MMRAIGILLALVGAPLAAATRHADFTSTISLGSIIVATLVGVAGLATFGYGVRWKSAYNVASTQAVELRRALEDERTRADRLGEWMEEAHKREVEQQATITRLEQLPNLERVLTLMAETAVAADRAARERLETALAQVGNMLQKTIDDHDQHAEGRTARLLEKLTELADRPAA